MQLESGRRYKIVGQQTLTVSSSAVSGTLPNNTEAVWFLVNDAVVRWRADGTSPTASVGKTERIRKEILLDDIEEINALEFIRVSSTDAAIDLIYLQEKP